MRLFLSAILTVFSVLPAKAELTNSDVWSILEKHWAVLELAPEIENTVTEDNKITHEGIVFRIESDLDSYSSLVSYVDWMSLTTREDGTVEIAADPIIQVELIEQNFYDDTETVYTIDIISNGVEIIASGDPEDLVIDYTIGTQKIVMNDIPNTDFLEANLRGMISNSVGSVHYYEAEGETISASTQSAEHLSLSFIASGDSYYPDSEASVVLDMIAQDFAYSGIETLTPVPDQISNFDDIPVGEITSSIQNISIAYDIRGVEGNIENYATGVFDIGNILLGGGLSDSNFAFMFSMEDLTSHVDINADDFVEYFDVSLDGILYDFGVDFRPDVGTADGYYRSSLSNLVASANLWDLIDPTAEIPRDPINTEVEVSASAEFSPVDDEFDFADSDVDDVLKFISISLDKYLVQAAGVIVDATGNAWFDFEDYDDYADMPAMNGYLHVDLKGAFDLIGKLLELDILDAEIAFAVRTGIGMVGIRQQEGDHFISELEIDEKGNLTVNGKPFDMPF